MIERRSYSGRILTGTLAHLTRPSFICSINWLSTWVQPCLLAARISRVEQKLRREINETKYNAQNGRPFHGCSAAIFEPYAGAGPNQPRRGNRDCRRFDRRGHFG